MGWKCLICNNNWGGVEIISVRQMCNWFMQYSESVSGRFSKSAICFWTCAEWKRSRQREALVQGRGGTRVTQTSVLWQHYGNISFSSRLKELHHLTVHIYIQRRAFGVTAKHTKWLRQWRATVFLSCQTLAVGNGICFASTLILMDGIRR